MLLASCCDTPKMTCSEPARLVQAPLSPPGTAECQLLQVVLPGHNSRKRHEDEKARPFPSTSSSHLKKSQFPGLPGWLGLRLPSFRQLHHFIIIIIINIRRRKRVEERARNATALAVQYSTVSTVQAGQLSLTCPFLDRPPGCIQPYANVNSIDLDHAITVLSGKVPAVLMYGVSKVEAAGLPPSWAGHAGCGFKTDKAVESESLSMVLMMMMMIMIK